MEYGLMACTDYMNVGRPVIVWVNRNAQSMQSENGWYETHSTTNPKRLGF